MERIIFDDIELFIYFNKIYLTILNRGFISSLDTTFVEQYNITDTTSGFSFNSSFIIGYLGFLTFVLHIG